MDPRARDQLGYFKDLGANFGCNRYSHNLIQCARRALKGNPDSTFDLGYIDLAEDLATPGQPVRPEVVTYVLGRYRPLPMSPVCTWIGGGDGTPVKPAQVLVLQGARYLLRQFVVLSTGFPQRVGRLAPRGNRPCRWHVVHVTAGTSTRTRGPVKAARGFAPQGNSPA